MEENASWRSEPSITTRCNLNVGCPPSVYQLGTAEVFTRIAKRRLRELQHGLASQNDDHGDDCECEGHEHDEYLGLKGKAHPDGEDSKVARPSEIGLDAYRIWQKQSLRRSIRWSSD